MFIHCWDGLCHQAGLLMPGRASASRLGLCLQVGPLPPGWASATRLGLCLQAGPPVIAQLLPPGSGEQPLEVAIFTWGNRWPPYIWNRKQSYLCSVCGLARSCSTLDVAVNSPKRSSNRSLVSLGPGMILSSPSSPFLSLLPLISAHECGVGLRWDFIEDFHNQCPSIRKGSHF